VNKSRNDGFKAVDGKNATAGKPSFLEVDEATT
jgi:hypothetical protein